LASMNCSRVGSRPCRRSMSSVGLLPEPVRPLDVSRFGVEPAARVVCDGASRCLGVDGIFHNPTHIAACASSGVIRPRAALVSSDIPVAPPASASNSGAGWQAAKRWRRQ
jgi:hypothetical protein